MRHLAAGFNAIRNVFQIALHSSSILCHRVETVYPIKSELNLKFCVEVEIVSENVKTRKVTFSMGVMKKYADCSPGFL